MHIKGRQFKTINWIKRQKLLNGFHAIKLTITVEYNKCCFYIIQESKCMFTSKSQRERNKSLNCMRCGEYNDYVLDSAVFE